MIDLESKLLSALNLFCFQNIWNESNSEMRANIVPILLQQRSITGTVYFNGKNYYLPTTNEPYYVYTIPASLMYVFAARQVPDQWIDTTELCNKYDILIHTYHLSGKMMQKKSVFLKKIGNYYLLVISKKMAQTCLTFDLMKDIRITMYFDSDLVNKITVRSDTVPYTDESYLYRRFMYDFIQNASGGNSNITVYINGYETLFQDINTFPTSTYVDIIHDANQILEFEIDLSLVENNVAFYSDKDQTHKQLIHIPKELNPTNKILTHNTCDIHVRQKLPDGSIGKGLYLHRCATRSVDQVTHNDISIPMFIMDAYRDYLGTQEITVRVAFRQHDKDNVLIRDKNYIDLLYTQDDATIIKHLLGKIRPTNLAFWKASNLEKSTYVKMMFDIPNFITAANMTQYVEGLGYYHVMTLLCKKIVHTDILEWYNQVLNISKPYLFMNNPVYPFVYLNQNKIPMGSVLHNNFDQLNLSVGIDPIVQIVPGDKLTIEMFVDGPKTIYRMQPIVGTTQIDISYTDFVVLEEHDISIHPVNQLDLESTKSYTEFTDYIGNIVLTNIDGGKRLTFGPQMYNRTFIIQPRHRVYSWSKNIDQDLTNGNPIYLPLHHDVRDAGYATPIWFTPHVRVYLNGKYLIQNIDFTIYECKDSSGRLSTKLINIQNLEYLLPEGNSVEWFVTSAIEENEVHGYSADLKAAVPTELALLFANMTMVHIDGVYEQSVIDKGNYIGVPDNNRHRQGAPFQVCTTVPEVVNQFLSTYHPNDDLDTLKKLNDYFYGKQPVLSPIVVLPKSHKCFSNYVVTVIRDILNGTLKGISFDPDEVRMKNQFVEYEYLKSSDLVFSGDYDLNYVDVFPHYKQIIVPNPEVYQILQEFIRITMSQDSVTSGEVYYDN